MNNETFTFTTICNRFEITVSKAWCSMYGESIVYQYDVYNLMTEFHINKYLHNPNGPSIISKLTGLRSYHIEGKAISTEEGERRTFNFKFKNEVDELLK